MTTRELRVTDMAVPRPAHIRGRPDREGHQPATGRGRYPSGRPLEAAGDRRSWKVARPAVCHYFTYRSEGCLTVGVYQCLHFTCRDGSVSLGCPA